MDVFKNDKSGAYENVFIKTNSLNMPNALNPLLIVVDTHIPYLVAAPSLLDRIKNNIRQRTNLLQKPICLAVGQTRKNYPKEETDEDTPPQFLQMFTQGEILLLFYKFAVIFHNKKASWRANCMF